MGHEAGARPTLRVRSVMTTDMSVVCNKRLVDDPEKYIAIGNSTQFGIHKTLRLYIQARDNSLNERTFANSTR